MSSRARTASQTCRRSLRRAARQLHGNARYELARRLQLAAAARKEEASAQAALVVTAASDGARDDRLSGAGHDVKPVYALAVAAAVIGAARMLVGAACRRIRRRWCDVADPCHNLGKQCGARVGQTLGLVLPLVAVECR
jgi:hypothetical protein